MMLGGRWGRWRPLGMGAMAMAMAMAMAWGDGVGRWRPLKANLGSYGASMGARRPLGDGARRPLGDGARRPLGDGAMLRGDGAMLRGDLGDIGRRCWRRSRRGNATWGHRWRLGDRWAMGAMGYRGGIVGGDVDGSRRPLKAIGYRGVMSIEVSMGQ